MKKSILDIKERLTENGLKVTPQRLAVLEAFEKLKNHPTAECILENVRKSNPNIASGTVYKVLETLVKHQLIRKVKTENDVMRYDSILTHHHHLYCSECNKIVDYTDDKLDKIIRDHFSRKKIKGFRISDIRLQINGEFDEDPHRK